MKAQAIEISKDQQFKDFVRDVQFQWEAFDKNLIIECNEFHPAFKELLEKHNLEMVNDTTFESNLLDLDRTFMVDSFTDSGESVFGFVASELFALGRNPYEHYADILSLSVQYI